MRAPAKPWYRASKDAWYVEFNGEQVRLAKGQDNYKAALDAFYKLMANGTGKLPDAHTPRVATVCDMFIDHSQKCANWTGLLCGMPFFPIASQAGVKN